MLRGNWTEKKTPKLKLVLLGKLKINLVDVFYYSFNATYQCVVLNSSVDVTSIYKVSDVKVPLEG